jgi:fructokinase
MARRSEPKSCSARSWERGSAAVSSLRGGCLRDAIGLPASGGTIRCRGPTTANAPGIAAIAGRAAASRHFYPGAGLAREYFGRSRRTLAPQDIVAAAATGADNDAVSSISAYKDRLARGLASIINVVDPEVVVLGGGLSNIDALHSGLADLIAAFAFSDDINTKIVKAMHGDSSGVRGAAWLWPPKKGAQTGG